MAEIIRYEHVDISFNGEMVIHDCNFSVNKGEILGIVGESGSGKSSLIKAAMGLLGHEGLVTRGDIWYKGMDLPDLSAKDMRKICGKEIGMIFQMAGTSFCPIRRVRDQLYEFMSEHESISKADFEKQAHELLQKFGFEDTKRILDSYPFELSGGMQQRVGIAAAMLLKPKILMADEPTSALDVTVQKQVVEEMLMIRKNFGTAILLVTHNLGVIRAMADKLLVLKNGETMEYGFTKEDVDRIRYIGLVHDIGKVGIPDAILNKPGKLDDEEFALMKQHAVIGYELLGTLKNSVDGLLDGIRHHHERYDGKGYPDGLAGEEIPLVARMICLCDCYDAMTTNRVYRPRLEMEKVRSEFVRCKGSQFDSHLADIFIRLMDEGKLDVD